MKGHAVDGEGARGLATLLAEFDILLVAGLEEIGGDFEPLFGGSGELVAVDVLSVDVHLEVATIVLIIGSLLAAVVLGHLADGDIGLDLDQVLLLNLDGLRDGDIERSLSTGGGAQDAISRVNLTKPRRIRMMTYTAGLPSTVLISALSPTLAL